MGDRLGRLREGRRRLRGSYAIASGVGDVAPVDLQIPGCLPSPAALLKGLLALMSGKGK
jgi:Ni,Fe-hydrogenase III small subunit